MLKVKIPALDVEKTEKAYGPGVRVNGSVRFALSKKNQSILETDIGQIKRDETIFIPTRGTWGTVHLIAYLIDQIGPVECTLTSWSVKEQAVRILLQLMDEGKITKLQCLFDSRITAQCPQAHQLIVANISDIKLMKIHAKCVVLKNADWEVTISTSANLTRNPRVESYVVTTHKEVAAFFTKWITEELSDAQPFGDDRGGSRKSK